MQFTKATLRITKFFPYVCRQFSEEMLSYFGEIAFFLLSSS